MPDQKATIPGYAFPLLVEESIAWFGAFDYLMSSRGMTSSEGYKRVPLFGAQRGKQSKTFTPWTRHDMLWCKPGDEFRHRERIPWMVACDPPPKIVDFTPYQNFYLSYFSSLVFVLKPGPTPAATTLAPKHGPLLLAKYGALMAINASPAKIFNATEEIYRLGNLKKIEVNFTHGRLSAPIPLYKWGRYERWIPDEPRESDATRARREAQDFYGD